MGDADRIVVATVVSLAAVAVVGLLFLGPVGWMLAGCLVLATIAFAGWSGLFEDPTAPERRNCDQCGAPNPSDADGCTHCGAEL